LFYQFENKYFNSLQNRNKEFINNVKSTINKKGNHLEKEIEPENSFAKLYESEVTGENRFKFWTSQNLN
jgi:hypothetical protein